ncbi:hypothetical protein HDE_08314 [Halotydeus destructor]|nr:hypothetical protein HDE_08314 [Halotydeus destructor]
MDRVKQHCNAYGFLGAFTALCTAVAWFLVDSKGDECIRAGLDQLQNYHVVAMIGAIVICVCGFFDVHGSLKQMIIVFYIATIVIAALGALLAYTAYLAFERPCTPAFGLIPIDSSLYTSKNVIKAEDGKMIAVVILDICSAFMMFSASGTFYRM